MNICCGSNLTSLSACFQAPHYILRVGKSTVLQKVAFQLWGTPTSKALRAPNPQSHEINPKPNPQPFGKHDPLGMSLLVALSLPIFRLISWKPGGAERLNKTYIVTTNQYSQVNRIHGATSKAMQSRPKLHLAAQGFGNHAPWVTLAAWRSLSRSLRTQTMTVVHDGSQHQNRDFLSTYTEVV